MHQLNRATAFAGLAAAAVCGASFAPGFASADDTPSPCAALKRIVAASPGFAALNPDDGKAAALPYGEDAQCAATHDQNSPSRQHFYLGARGHRTEIVAATAGTNKLKLVISGNK